MHEFFFLAGKHFINRNTGPFGNDIGNIFFGNGFGKAVFMSGSFILGRFNFIFQFRNNAVLQFPGPFKAALAFGYFNLNAGFVEFFF